MAGVSEAQDPSYWRNSAVEFSGALESSGTGTADLRETAAAIPPGNGPMAAMALTVPAAMDTEVAALAQALGTGQAVPGEDGTAKALRIFNWV